MLSAQLVADINPADYGSFPAEPVSINGVTFFTADDGLHGRELWKTDGTDAGTVLVKDINPGAAASSPIHLTRFGDTLLFAANDGTSGQELWRSDGTEAGTTRVVDLNPNGSSNATGDPRDAYSTGAAVVGNRFYFSATDGASGVELWATDGSEAGTYQVKDLNPGPGSSGPARFSSVGNTLLFEAAVPGITGRQVWKTDGTDAGTAELSFPPNGPANIASPVAATAGGYRYYSSYNVATQRYTLWRTDGTAAGTIPLKQDLAGQFGTFVDVAGTMFMWGNPTGAVNGTEIWKSDGTVAGTVKVAGGNWDFMGFPQAAGNRVLFPVSHLNTGRWDLWSTDGTAAGTTLVRGFTSIPGNNEVIRLAVLNGVGYFTADDGTTTTGRRLLWRTDGTPAGTLPVSAQPVSFGAAQPSLAVAGGYLYVTPERPDAGGELWRTDGTANGLRLIKDINRLGVGSNPVPGFELNGYYYFSANVVPGATGDLYRTDGSPSGTSLVRAGVNPFSPTKVGQTVYFVSGSDLWKTDGTPQGTVPIHPASGGVHSFEHLAAYNGRLYFAAVDGAGEELWTSDGTDAGTFRLADLNPGADSSTPSDFTTFNGQLYFWARAKSEFGTAQTELFRTDGTPQGTVRVRGPDDQEYPRNERPGMVVMGNRLYFFASDTTTAYLWKTDGTVAGTEAVYGFNSSDAPRGLTAAGSHVFFATSGTTGLWPWASDGTANGTMTLSTVDALPIPSSSSGAPVFFAMGPQVFFRGRDFEAGTELWRSTGTPAGTNRVADLVPGEVGSDPVPMAVGDGLLFFAATDANGDRELWRTTGIETGTVRVEDVNPGPRSSNPTGGFFVPDGPLGGTVFFTATSDPTGPELWKTTTGRPSPPHVVGRYVFYNDSAFDGNDAAANALDDAAIATNKSALRPGVAPSFANITSYTRGINGVMVDVAGLPTTAALTIDDFDFGGAPAPLGVMVRRGAGAGGSDRVTLVWRDYNPTGASPGAQAVADGWLTVTVKANAHTGLSAPDVFSFGNLIGDAVDGGTANATVNVLDLARVRATYGTAAAASTSDVNHDGKVNATDLAVVRGRMGRTLSPPAAVQQATVAAPLTLAARPRLRPAPPPVSLSVLASAPR